VYAPAGDAAYATPNGEIVHVPQDFAFADTVVALDDELPAPSRPPASIPAPPSRPPHSRPPTSYREQHTRQHELAELHAQQQLHQQMQMQQMQAYGSASQGPISRPPPHPMGADPGLVTSVRGAFQRAKYTIDSSRGEIKELWSATETSDAAMSGDEKDPLVRLARRVRTFWGFFEWDKDDVARAAWIGLAVFVIAVCTAFVIR
jgi:hypothetical protein